MSKYILQLDESRVISLPVPHLSQSITHIVWCGTFIKTAHLCQITHQATVNEQGSVTHPTLVHAVLQWSWNLFEKGLAHLKSAEHIVSSEHISQSCQFS